MEVWDMFNGFGVGGGREGTLGLIAKTIPALQCPI